jgi:hypothetical protein
MSEVFEESGPLDEAAHAARLFASGLVIFRQTLEAFDLLETAQEIIAEAFAPHDPLIAHETLGEAAFGARAEALGVAYEKRTPFPRRWHGGTISASLEAIWGMSVSTNLEALDGRCRTNELKSQRWPRRPEATSKIRVTG